MALSVLEYLIDYLLNKMQPSWLALIGAAAVVLLATVNSFIHTADGWTAVVPSGLTLSVLTLLAMVATWWFARNGVYHVSRNCPF